jgi:hypothetical protein
MRIKWNKPNEYQTEVSGIIGLEQSKFYFQVSCTMAIPTITFQIMPEKKNFLSAKRGEIETLKELQQAAQRLWDVMWFSLSDYDFSTTNTPEP